MPMQPRHPNILVVDDTSDNLNVLCRVLDGHGYKTRPALSGEIALNFLQKNIVPDLILLDIAMAPGIDGFEVCRRLKAEERTRDIPIIFISAREELNDKLTAFEVGGVDYITKPFQEAEVLARVKTHLDLREARLLADQANRAKSVFLSNMGHELRTPLNVILGFVQLMARNPQMPPEELEHLRTIQRSGDYLLALINQVLDLSKIETDRITLRPEPFNLYDLLTDIQRMVILKAEQKGLELNVRWADSVPGLICADEVRLQQIIINLLNNAIKFTAAGAVTLRIAGERLHDAAAPPSDCVDESAAGRCMLHIEITDTGPGMTPEELDHVFDPFTQAAAGRQAPEGSGLGLSISRAFARMMGGDVTLESEPGRGTTARASCLVDIPEGAPLQQRPGRRHILSLEPGQPRYRILIADDHADCRTLLARLLDAISSAGTGLEVQEASSGADTLALWERWQPHLIWLDIKMPDMSGYEVAARIREHDNGRTMLVAMTASSFEMERERALRAGCNDFVRKPFREADIFACLRRHLGLRFIDQDSDLAPPQVLTPEEMSAGLAALPDALLAELSTAVERVDLTLTRQLIARISASDPVLAEALGGLLKGFRFDVLQTLIITRNPDSEGPA